MHALERLRRVVAGPRTRAHARSAHPQFRAHTRPRVALRELGRRLAEAVPDEQVADEVVTVVRQCLAAPYVAVEVGARDVPPVLVAHGVPTRRVLTYLMVHRGVQVGRLLVGYDEDAPIDRPERGLLAELADRAGAAVHRAGLAADLRRTTEDLKRAREHLVLTRDEERRRMRRDLHDGLAPTLAAAELTSAAAADLVDRDPRAAEQMLERLQHTLRAAIADIRTLVDELHPPALELGLLPALREHVTGIWPVLAADVEAPDSLPPLPAAVEVAAYRICQEALMNVVKHADAHHVLIRVAAADRLQLEILDDGVGLPRQRTGDSTGVGLGSMRDRAHEVGGRFLVESMPGGGTRVSVSLPLGG
jgi:signal transduction histidine kinase